MSADLELDELQALRQQVLSLWPTGQDIDLNESVAFAKQLPPGKNCAVKLTYARQKGDTLLQPRAAVPVINDHIELMQSLENEGDADILPTAMDSYSRELQFEQARAGLEASIQQGRPLLNGLPIVNRGHKPVGALLRQSIVRPVYGWWHPTCDWWPKPLLPAAIPAWLGR